MADSALGPRAVFSNFFANLPNTSETGEEALEILAQSDNVVIERIVSQGHTSDQWYNQEETEFCAVLRGAADLLFDYDDKPVRMEPGEWVIIPPHVRHKVSWTPAGTPTIWVAVKWKK